MQRSITVVEVSAAGRWYQYPCATKTTRNSSLTVNKLHVPVPQIQDPVEYDEPLAIGDMVVNTSFVLSREWRLFALDISSQQAVLSLVSMGSYSYSEWTHRDQFVKLTNKRRRVSE